MATQLLNAGADLVTIQQILGHSQIETTMQYSRLSNLKAQNDYYQAMDRVMRSEYAKQ
jgi:site-specific recombinase XerD